MFLLEVTGLPDKQRRRDYTHWQKKNNNTLGIIQISFTDFQKLFFNRVLNSVKISVLKVQ